MGAWGFGSEQADGPLDWYPLTVDGDRRVVPTARALNRALDDWLAAPGQFGEFPMAEFLGIVIAGLNDRVKARRPHLRKALTIARALVADERYLKSYGRGATKRRQALRREIARLVRATGVPS